MAKQERAVRTRDALIGSAAEIFDREGYTVASLTAISSLAGVSNGALHFHFASKAALADAVEAAALLRLAAVTGDPHPPGDRHPPGGRRLQDLVDATHRLAGALRADVVLRAGFQLCGESARPPEEDLREQWRAWVEGAVRQAELAGELRPGVAVADVVAAVVAATVGLEVLGARDTRWLSAATVTRLWRLLLPTLVPSALAADLAPEGSRPSRPL